MKYCVKCVMPDTRPGIRFNDQGVCYPCINADRRKTIDWKRRQKELRKLCDRYRKSDGSHDCIVTVSGGKDSWFQVYVMKEIMGMNPLLLNVWNLSWTVTGMMNFDNLSEVFSTECISLHMNRKVSKAFMRKAFFKLGSPTWYWDKAVYVYPIKMAMALKIPLVVYGENIAYEYGGPGAKETYSALDQMSNDVVKPVDNEEWLDDEITISAMNYVTMPPYKVIEEFVEPIYLSYFFPWDGFKNMNFASSLGFKTLGDTNEWIRQGFIEDYDQIDSPGYLVHPWLKYPKFGHARATDVSSNLIRNGYITRSMGIELVKKHDHRLDSKVVEDFLSFTGIPPIKFFEKIDSLYNRDIFYKDGDTWKLKNPIWEERHGEKREPETTDVHEQRGGTATGPDRDSAGKPYETTSGYRPEV